MSKGQGRIKYLLKNTMIFTIGNFATKLISFFLVPIYTQALSASEYGTADLVTTICTVLAPIVILNIGEAIMRFCLDKNVDAQEALDLALIIYIIAMFVSILIFPINSMFTITSRYSMYIYFYVISLAGSQILLCYLRGREKLVLYSMGNILNSLLIALFNILFLIVLKKGIEGYFCSYILASTVTIFYVSFVIKIWNRFRYIKFNRKLFINMVKYSIVLIPNTFMWWIMNSSDRIMVTTFLGAAANGIYAISYKIPSVVQTFSNIFNQAWSYSAIKEDDSEDRDEYCNKIFQFVIAISSTSAIFLLLILKPLLKVYVGSSYYSAWKYTPFLILGYVFLTIATFLATSYTVHKDSKGYLYSGICGAICNLVLNGILIPLIGVYGAALATCVSYFIVFLYRYYDTKKYLKIKVFTKKNILVFFNLIFCTLSIFIQNIGFVLLAILLIVNVCLFKNIYFNMDILKKIKRKE